MYNLTPTSPACKNSAHPASSGALLAELHESVSHADAAQRAALALAPYKPEADAGLVLDNAARSKHIGGKTQRPPPEAAQWLALLPPLGSTSWAGAAGQFPDATDAELVERMHCVYLHRGRLGGLSELDYAYQHEVLASRSLNDGFFLGRKRCTTAYTNDLPDALALVLLGRDPFGYRRRLLAMLVTADRMRKWGFCIGAPDGAAVLGCSVPTWWRVIAWAERMGYLYRVHTYKRAPKAKPGTKAPVQLASNFYGAGPALIEHRGAYSVADATDAGKLYDLFARELSKQRKRWRESRRATVARYRAELPPVEAGEVFDVETFLDEPELDLLEDHEDELHRAAVREITREKSARYAFKKMEAEAAAYFDALAALEPLEEPAEVSPEGDTAKALRGNLDNPQTCHRPSLNDRPAHQLPSHADMGPPSGVKLRKLRRDSRRSFPPNALAVSPSGDTLAGSAHPLEGTGLPPGDFEIKPAKVHESNRTKQDRDGRTRPLARGKSRATISAARAPRLAVTLTPSDPEDEDKTK